MPILRLREFIDAEHVVNDLMLSTLIFIKQFAVSANIDQVYHAPNIVLFPNKQPVIGNMTFPTALIHSGKRML